MPLIGYDFNDYLIRDMVRRNHEPCEPTLTDDQGTAVLTVCCHKCTEPWPCTVTVAYREWEAAQPTEGPTPAVES